MRSLSPARGDIRRLMIAIDQIDRLYYRAVRQLGIKSNTFVLLYALADGSSYSQKQISEEWSVPRTTLNTIVRECKELGYLELLPTGGKEKDIRLTESGKRWADSIIGPIFAAEERALAADFARSLSDRMEAAAAALTRELTPIASRKTKH